MLLARFVLLATAAHAAGFALSPAQPARIASRGVVAASSVTMEERQHPGA